MRCLWNRLSVKMSQDTVLESQNAVLSGGKAVIIKATFLAAATGQLRNPQFPRVLTNTSLIFSQKQGKIKSAWVLRDCAVL